jgi:arylsulfatase A-like enzyme
VRSPSSTSFRQREWARWTELLGEGGIGGVWQQLTTRDHHRQRGDHKEYNLSSLIGQTLSHFHVTAKLGEGGIGSVCRRVILLPVLLCVGCADPPTGPSLLTAEAPLHLEDALDAAVLENSAIPTDIPEAMEWSFDGPNPTWKPAYWGFTDRQLTHPNRVSIELAEFRQTDEALRLRLTEENRDSDGDLIGALYVELPDLKPEAWSHVIVEARIPSGVNGVMILGFNLVETARPGVVQARHTVAPFMVADDTVRQYVLNAEPSIGAFDGTWRQLVLGFVLLGVGIGDQPGAVDILSVKIIPRAATYASSRAGTSIEARDRHSRRTLFMHAPGRLVYRVRIPPAGRLDVGIGATQSDAPVTYRVTATPSGADPQLLLEETTAETEHWTQRQVDLSHLAGETVMLALEATADRAGTVALWAAPTLTGDRMTDKPNVILYVIDGGGADYLSTYGYHRRTTNLERLAAEGAVFERAHSNSGWTRPSTPSFLTSLQHSVLGGLENWRNPVPEDVLTLAEHMHRAGYQTAELTTNANAGSMSGLDRGNDMFREAGVKNQSMSAVRLHEDFWTWRAAYPGGPFWVHFQTTDVHNPHTPFAPFAGLFVDSERRRVADEWTELTEKIPETEDVRIVEALDQIGADQTAYWSAQRDLHDEAMAHQDYRLGRLVARLKATGEWERTLLIIAGDHSVAAGSWDYGLLMRDPQPAHVYRTDWATPLLRSGVSRVPLIVVWPGHIAPGQRFSQPVSMLDLLPTILDLTDLPMPEVMQGQSLAPLFLGETGWEPRPVILDYFEVDSDTGELRGHIEVIDDRWGASLEINPDPELHEKRRSAAPLLLYDLWEDPYALNSLHAERPDLVEKYTKFLKAQFRAHQALAQRFSRAEDAPLTAEQLKTLRSLGYIQ